MAERRMFAKNIVLSDAFLDMPTTTRCLYFTLAMVADDDGFVNSPKSIMRQTGASEDDLKLLFAKRYILGFDSGVIVIKHWKIHNIIQKDRYKETTYLEEKSMLTLDGKKAYTEAKKPLDTLCIQSVSNLDTQVSIGKDRLGKDRLVVEEEDSSATECNSQLKPVGGKIGKGVVFMTDEQFDALLDKIGSIEVFDKYVEKLAKFIIDNDANVGNHYETILKWYKQDTKV